MTTGQGNALMPTEPGRGMEGAREDLSPQSADCLHSEPGTALNRLWVCALESRHISMVLYRKQSVLEDR